MAAGRNRGYGYNDHRDKNTGKKYSHSRREYDRIRTGGVDYSRYHGHVQEITSKVRVRQDINEGDMSSGFMYSSSRSNSDSRSDETSVLENGPALPVDTKKRKFTPIVWDKDVMAVRDTSRSTASTFVDTGPPLSKSIFQSSDHGEQITRMEGSDLQRSENLLHEPPLELEAESRVDKCSSGLQKEWNGHREVALLEEDDCISTRNVAVSRWVDASLYGNEESNEDIVNRRGIIPLSESIGMRVRTKSLTPQLTERNREGSNGNRLRSSESEEGGYCGSSSSRGEHSSDDVDNNFMESDEEDYKGDTNLSQSESKDGNLFSRGTPEPVASPQRTVNMLRGCRSVEEFERLNRIDEGAYGVVYRAKDKKTGEIVVLKKVKMERETEGFPMTSLREINILLSIHHPSIVDVKEVVVGSDLDSIFMVMEYMEHDLKGLMETMKQPFSQSEVKCLMLQLLKGIKYLHDNWVLHRDLKTSNLLFNNRGELKICDLGMARQYGSPLKQYTHLVVTLWYRAPELLLGAKMYSTAIDMWSLGCIMAELLSKAPLFNGKTEFDQLDKIFRILGTPNESIWPGFSKLPGVKVNFVNNRYNLLRKKFPGTLFTGSPVLSDSGFDLLSKLLTYDPEKRITAEDALNHPWFSEVPLPKSKEFMPTFPAQHAQDRRFRRIMKSPDPLEEQRRKELQQGQQLGTGGLFG